MNDNEGQEGRVTRDGQPRRGRKSVRTPAEPDVAHESGGQGKQDGQDPSRPPKQGWLPPKKEASRDRRRNRVLARNCSRDGRNRGRPQQSTVAVLQGPLVKGQGNEGKRQGRNVGHVGSCQEEEERI